MTHDDPSEKLAADTVEAARTATGAHLPQLDEVVWSFHDHPEISWERVHAHVSRESPSILPLGGPGWRRGLPQSIVVFCDAAKRYQLAADDEDTPEAVLAILINDEDEEIRDEALSSLAWQHGQHRLRVQPSVQPQPTNTSPWLKGVLGFIVLAFIALGFFNAKFYEANGNQTDRVHTGLVNLVSTGTPICGDNQDYFGCMRAHHVMHQALCRGTELTAMSSTRCRQLESFVDEGLADARKCGAGCLTDAGGSSWGWEVQRLELVTAKPRERDEWLMADCHFLVGPMRIGDCSAAEDSPIFTHVRQEFSEWVSTK